MLILFQVFMDSFLQAIHQLWSNKLRTFLSLLGITIGIGCVIMVFSLVDSLEYNIKESFKDLGDDVLYVDIMPWNEDYGENYWKYERRPQPNFKDYKTIKEKAKTVGYQAYNVYIGTSTIDSEVGAMNNAFLMAITEEYNKIYLMNYALGRYFSIQEFQRGANSVIIGYSIYEALFPNGEDPIGKVIKVRGKPLKIIGVLKKQGKDMLAPMNYDEIAIIPYVTAARFINLNTLGKGRSSLIIKAGENFSVEAMKSEVTSILRANRYLQANEENNFAFNGMSLLADMVDNVLGVVRIAGLLIGGFAIIVGGFSVANIMFVSVKERTNLIGVKKALGAKRYIILMEFLIEAILLCLIGGAFGLVFVAILSAVATSLAGFYIFLSINNIILGLVISSIIGLIAGLLPAYMASKMQPVEAIRS